LRRLAVYFNPTLDDYIYLVVLLPERIFDVTRQLFHCNLLSSGRVEILVCTNSTTAHTWSKKAKPPNISSFSRTLGHQTTVVGSSNEAER
jgi:hypothetical protein